MSFLAVNAPDENQNSAKNSKIKCYSGDILKNNIPNGFVLSRDFFNQFKKKRQITTRS